MAWMTSYRTEAEAQTRGLMLRAVRDGRMGMVRLNVRLFSLFSRCTDVRLILSFFFSSPADRLLQLLQPVASDILNPRRLSISTPSPSSSPPSVYPFPFNLPRILSTPFLHTATRPSLHATDSSFIAETSFVRAPLNSRVVSSSAAAFPSYGEGGSVNGSGNTYSGANGGTRSGSEKDKGKGRQSSAKAVAREPLDRIPLDIQEAIILEDLLFVLMVSFLSC